MFYKSICSLDESTLHHFLCGEATGPFRLRILFGKAKHAFANVVFGSAGRGSVFNGTGIRFLRRIWPTSFICNSNLKERSFYLYVDTKLWTHRDLIKLYGVLSPFQSWFRWWLVVCSGTSHYLNHCHFCQWRTYEQISIKFESHYSKLIKRFMPWIGVYHGEMDVIQWTWYFFSYHVRAD